MDIEFESFILSPLNSNLVALDYKTVTENKTYLRSIMGWGDWPSDSLTMESDARALSKHYEEFKQQKAFAFSVLNKTRDQLTGCVYIYPLSNTPNTVRLHLWVAEKKIENNLDMKVLDEILILLPKWGSTMPLFQLKKTIKEDAIL